MALTRRHGSAAVCAVLGCVLLLGMLVRPGSGAGGTLGVGLKHNIPTTIVAPDGPGPYPGMLVLATSRGVEPRTLAYAGRLAEAGYVAFVPRYLETYGLTGDSRGESFTRSAEAIYSDLAEAADELRHYDKVNGSKIGAVGFSNGGFFSVMLAARSKVQAGVDYYGAITGFGADKDLFRIKTALTSQSSPMLLLVGDKDGYYRPTMHLGVLLRDAGVPHAVHVYPGGPHEFEQFSTSDGEDAWSRTQAFLRRWLRTQP
jgi:carboxymethylenebutenolidase